MDRCCTVALAHMITQGIMGKLTSTFCKSFIFSKLIFANYILRVTDPLL